jgi:AcrR family transcriptional regulator
MSHHDLYSPSVREERATRILDAAVSLLLRWGYRRVTVDDIALEAAVGTGTIYLHWKSKEALFESVLLRELQSIWDELAQQMRNDPADVLLHHCLPALLRAVNERPLARALFTRDTTLLGKLTQSRLSRQSQQLLGADTFLLTLRQLGLMRDDMQLEVQAHAFSAIWIGFVLADTILRSENQADLAIQLDALEQTIRRTFEPDTLPDVATLRDTVAPQMIAFFEQARDQLGQQLNAQVIA